MSADETTLDEKVGIIAQEENVPYDVFRRLIFAESSDQHFDKNGNVKRSPDGAMGYGQLMPKTAAMLGVNPLDPMENLRGAARYFKMNLDRFDGNVMLALSAYNAGPTITAEIGGVPNYSETTGYISKILGIPEEQIPTVDVAAYRAGDYSPRPQLRPEEPQIAAMEEVEDPYATPLTSPIEYAPPEETTGIGAFEQFMPTDREKEMTELGPYDLRDEDERLYKKYSGMRPMTFAQAATMEEKSARGVGIGPLNYVARNMFLNRLE